MGQPINWDFETWMYQEKFIVFRRRMKRLYLYEEGQEPTKLVKAMADIVEATEKFIQGLEELRRYDQIFPAHKLDDGDKELPSLDEWLCLANG